MPRIASVRLAAGADRPSIRLFDAITVVPPERRIPLTAPAVVEIAPVSVIPQMLFLETLTVVPPLTLIPRVSGDVAPDPDSVLIVLLRTFWVVPPVIDRPITVEDAPVEDKPETLFPENVCVPEAELIPVMLPPPVTLLMVLPVAVPLPLKPTFNTVMAPLPPVILLNALFVTIVIGDPPSLFCHPFTDEVPARVILDKLLRLDVSVTVAGETALDMKNWTAPLVAGLLYVPTIELPLHVWAVLAAWVTLLLRKVAVPVLLAVMLVNVLLLMLVAPVNTWLLM